MAESKVHYNTPDPTPTSLESILDDIRNDRIFGFAIVWIHVPDHLVDYFSEFPPIFKNSEITIAEIGEHTYGFAGKSHAKSE